jgi:hypothetical protein
MAEWGARADAEARAVGAPDLAAGVYGHRAAVALFRGDAAEELLDDATDRLAVVDEVVLAERLQVGWIVGQLPLQSERFDAARGVLERALAAAGRSRHGAFTVTFHSLLGVAKHPLLDLAARSSTARSPRRWRASRG